MPTRAPLRVEQRRRGSAAAAERDEPANPRVASCSLCGAAKAVVAAATGRFVVALMTRIRGPSAGNSLHLALARRAESSGSVAPRALRVRVSGTGGRTGPSSTAVIVREPPGAGSTSNRPVMVCTTGFPRPVYETFRQGVETEELSRRRARRCEPALPRPSNPVRRSSADEGSGIARKSIVSPAFSRLVAVQSM